MLVQEQKKGKNEDSKDGKNILIFQGILPSLNLVTFFLTLITSTELPFYYNVSFNRVEQMCLNLTLFALRHFPLVDSLKIRISVINDPSGTCWSMQEDCRSH